MWCSLDTRICPSPAFEGSVSAESSLLSEESGWTGTSGRWCKCIWPQSRDECLDVSPMRPEGNTTQSWAHAFLVTIHAYNLECKSNLDQRDTFIPLYNLFVTVKYLIIN